jgi:hypothetical protein
MWLMMTKQIRSQINQRSIPFISMVGAHPKFLKWCEVIQGRAIGLVINSKELIENGNDHRRPQETGKQENRKTGKQENVRVNKKKNKRQKEK